MASTPLVKLNQLITGLNAYEFTLFSYLLGNIFCNGLNSLQIQALGNFFESIGQTMLTIGSQQESLGVNANYSSNNDGILNELKGKISNIEEIISNLKNLSV